MLDLLRKSVWPLTAVAATVALAAGFNLGGWRARVLIRLFEVRNYPIVVAPPPGFAPQVPPGFKASVFANGLKGPRWLAVAPSGDIFVAESGAGRILVLQDRDTAGKANARFTFAEGLRQPFGIAFHDQYVYIGDTDEVIRFQYDPRTSRRKGSREHILDLPGGGYNQHWTRTLAFSPDGSQLFISIGSRTNATVESDARRAAILFSDPEGKHARLYASGLRNAVGIGFNPGGADLWAAVNERDGLGDNTPDDYFTHVVEGGFYGWPYSYLDRTVRRLDARAWPARPDLVARTIVPDVFLGAHVAPLQFAFYAACQFPSAYSGGVFIAEHGSWNRTRRAGYQVVFLPFHEGRPAGAPQAFFSGFVPSPSGRQVYGRMAGVATSATGSLLVADDAGNVIWQVSYQRAN